jgi:DNA-binding response OmpR family regulator
MSIRFLCFDDRDRHIGLDFAAMNVRIDFVDPGPEGAGLSLVLRDARFDVVERAMDTVERTSADVLVLAGDAQGALDALRRLRDDGASPGIPVVLLGTPDGISHRGGGEPGLGAEAVLLRPIDPYALLHALEKLAYQTKPSTRNLPAELLKDAEANEPSTAITARERTVQLSGDERPKLRAMEEDRERAGPSRDVIQKTPSTNPEESMTPSSSGGVRGPLASVSDRLRGLLLSADRRAFPTRPSIDMSLPGGDESAAELLPKELFEHDELLVDVLAIEEDSIDAFTFVGGPVLPEGDADANVEDAIERTPVTSPKSSPPTAPNRPSKLTARRASGDERFDDVPPRQPTELGPRSRGESWDATNAPNHTGVHESVLRPPDSDSPRREDEDWPSEDSVLGQLLDAESNYRGTIAEGGLLRVLFRATTLRRDARLVISIHGIETTLTLRDGELVLIEGDVAVRAARSLARRGANVPRSEGENAAKHALEQAVQRGVLSRLEHERALREAREQLLVESIRAPNASFTVERWDAERKPRVGVLPLGVPFRAALAEAARRAVSRAQLMQSVSGDFGFERTTHFDEVAAEGWIRPEMASLIAAHENVSVSRLLDEAQSEPGVPGLLSALVSAGALRIVPVASRAREDDRAPHARRMIEEAFLLSEDADYFRILSVSREASETELAEAYRARATELESIDLETLGLAMLEPTRRVVLDAMAEAHRVLRNPRWRDAYTNALRS